MTAPRLELARQHATDLSALTGRLVTTDPAELVANLPAVLIVPPEIRFDRAGGFGASVTWRLVVATDPPGGLAAWEQLDQLLEELSQHATITRATPGQYTVTGEPELDPLPAYICEAEE